MARIPDTELERLKKEVPIERLVMEFARGRRYIQTCRVRIAAIILCESIIDALTFWCADFRNETASYGVNGFTEDQKTAFVRHGVKSVWSA